MIIRSAFSTQFKLKKRLTLTASNYAEPQNEPMKNQRIQETSHQWGQTQDTCIELQMTSGGLEVDFN